MFWFCHSPAASVMDMLYLVTDTCFPLLVTPHIRATCHQSPVAQWATWPAGHTMVHSLHSLLVACQDGDTTRVETILQVMEVVLQLISSCM